MATNVLTEIARRTADASLRPQALSFSTRFDRMLTIPSGILVAITGIVAVVLFGYPLTTGWLLAATVLYAVIVATGILFWSRVGRAIDRAAAAGDDDAMRRELTGHGTLGVSRAENVALLAVIALMVLRPF